VEVEALEGQLFLFLPGQVMRLLAAARATGRLDLERNKERASIYLIDGRPVFARTSGVSVRVGEVLVSAGILRPEAVELVAAMQQDAPGERIGKMLVRSGLLSESEVHDAVVEVQRRILFGALLWREGTFRFHPGESASGEDIGLDDRLDLERVIAETLRIAGEPPAESKAA